MVSCLVALVVGTGGISALRSAPAESRTLRVEGIEVEKLGFDRLSSFPYVVSDLGTGATPEQLADPKRRDQLPAWVKAYDKKRVVLTGYMLPVQMEKGRAKKLILMRDVMTCCYGATPNMNDYVIVTVKGEGAPVVQDVPVAFVGTLHVGEKYESGYLVSVFEFDAEKVVNAGQ